MPCVTTLLTLVSAVDPETACDPVAMHLIPGPGAVLPAQGSSSDTWVHGPRHRPNDLCSTSNPEGAQWLNSILSQL